MKFITVSNRREREEAKKRETGGVRDVGGDVVGGKQGRGNKREWGVLASHCL